MKTLFNFKSRLQKTYGWDVELTCSQCGQTRQPRYEGWSPSLDTHRSGNVGILAKLACPQCGRRLTDEAAKKLIELFRGIDIPEKNKKIITRFITRLFLVPAGLAFVLMFGMQMDWWGWGLGTVWILLVSAIVIPVLVSKKNREISDQPAYCECGKPHYVYMGSLENNDCYRCFSCGRLLKIRE